MIALLLFSLGSLLCGLARNVEVLITFRVLQGVGGGLLTPVGIAMLMRAFPPAERAQAAALIAIPTVVAPASGPVLGGYLVEYQSWHWIFFINVPIGAVGLIAAALFLREEKQPKPGRLDVPGFLLSAAGLACVMYALAEAGPRGFDDARVILFGLLGLALLVTFTFVELRTAEPMIDVRLFGNKLFRAAIVVQFIGFAGFAGTLFLLPLLLQAEMGLSPLQSGLATFPQAIGVAMMVQPVGRLYVRLGPRRMMMTGMAGAAVVTLSFLLVDLDTSQWWIRLIMLVRGWFFAFTLVTLPAAAYATISSEATGRATAIFNTGQQVGSSFGVALLATVLTNRLIHHHSALGVPGTEQSALLAFHDAFIAASVLVALAVGLALFIDDKEAAGTMRQSAPTATDREPLAATPQPDQPTGGFRTR
jgi:EmrB/QacA subfamily drug resistance transporter